MLDLKKRARVICGVTAEKYYFTSVKQTQFVKIIPQLIYKNQPHGTVCEPEVMQTDTVKQAGVYWSYDGDDLSFARISSEDNRTAEVFSKAAPGVWQAGC